jgi:hypothetical protein
MSTSLAHPCYAGGETADLVNLNLETLKTEILDYLTASEFAVFHSYPGGLEGMPVIMWDTEKFPDYHMFLETARKLEQKLILLASRELEEAEIAEAMEELEEADMTRDERRDFEGRMREARRHTGNVCALELGFDHSGHLYVFEVRPDWYEDFVDACDEIEAMLPAIDGTEGGGHDSLGGFYSNN